MPSKIKLYSIAIIGLILIIFFSALIVNYLDYLSILFFISITIGIIGLSYALKYPFYLVIALILTLPFERFPTFKLGDVDLKVNQVAAGLMIVGWIFSMAFNKLKIRPNALIIPMLLFISVMFFSLSHSLNLPRAIMVIVFTIFVFGISLAINGLIDNKEKLRLAVKYLIGVSVFICLFGFYQFAGDMIGLPHTLTVLKDIYTKQVFGFPRIHAFSMEPLYFANFLLIPLGISAAFFFNSQVKEYKNRYFWITLIVFVSIVLSLSRGAYLGLAGLVVYMLLIWPKKILTLKNLIFAGAGIVIGLASIFLLLQKVSPDAYTKFIDQATVRDYGQSQSTVDRLNAYQTAIEAWKTSPLVGISPGNYGPYVKPDSQGGWDIVNNEYLEILAEEGFLGLLLFIIMIAIIYIRSYHSYHKVKDGYLKSLIVGQTAALTGILIQYNFFSTLYIVYIWFFIGLIVATQNLCLKKEADG